MGQVIAAQVPSAPIDSPSETTAGCKDLKPVMGGKYGTCFDISVLKERDTYRMWLSWRPKKSIALVESKDGIHWSEPPSVACCRRKRMMVGDDVI